MLDLLARCRLKVTDLHGRIPSSGLTGSRVELGTERESLLQMLDENANFGGQPAAGGPYDKDWHGSLKGSQKTDDSAFSEFCGEEPCWRLGNPQMFEDTHPHLFNIAGTKDSSGDNALPVLSRTKVPLLHGPSLDEDNRSKAFEIVRRFRFRAGAFRVTGGSRRATVGRATRGFTERAFTGAAFTGRATLRAGPF